MLSEDFVDDLSQSSTNFVALRQRRVHVELPRITDDSKNDRTTHFRAGSCAERE
jgi:hypothetical protein